MAGLDDEFEGESRLSDWANVSHCFLPVLAARAKGRTVLFVVELWFLQMYCSECTADVFVDPITRHCVGLYTCRGQGGVLVCCRAVVTIAALLIVHCRLLSSGHYDSVMTYKKSASVFFCERQPVEYRFRDARDSAVQVPYNSVES